MTDLARHVTRFFTEYLPERRGASPNTVKAYRDVFTILLRYYRDERRVAPDRLTLADITVTDVLSFLGYLEEKRGCGARTRNHRLATLHSFFRYLLVEEPSRMVSCQQILAIPLRRVPRTPVSYLGPEDLASLLGETSTCSRSGRRDAVLLSLLYDTGARVQELVDLSIGDVRLDAPAQVRLRGKGRKTRIVPLMTNTVDALRAYLRQHDMLGPERAGHPLFENRWGERLTRAGVAYLLKKYVRALRARRPDLPKRLGPHTLRHSKAMHLLQAGVPLVIIRDVLGHSDVRTTEIYARVDLETKTAALARVAPIASPGTSSSKWRDDKSLVEWLRSL